MAPFQMNYDDIDYSSTSVTSDNRFRARSLRRQVESRESRNSVSAFVNRQRRCRIVKL